MKRYLMVFVVLAAVVSLLPWERFGECAYQVLALIR